MRPIPMLVLAVLVAAAAACASQEKAAEAPAAEPAAAPEGAPPAVPPVTVADAVPGPETQPPPDGAPPPVTRPRPDRPAADPIDVRAEVSAAIDEATGTIRGIDGGPDLPAFPGARIVSREVDTGDERWSRTVEVELEADEGFDRVRRFYETAIRSEGWSVTGLSESEDKAEWKLAAGSSVASVEVKRDGRRRVKIELERRDR